MAENLTKTQFNNLWAELYGVWGPSGSNIFTQTQSNTMAGIVKKYLFPPGNLRLNTQNVTVVQNSGNTIVEVERYGGSSGVVSVKYNSVDGTAKAGIDYTAVNGTLSWADGETGVKTISIKILDNKVVDGNTSRQFSLKLGVPTGTTLVGSSSLTISVTEYDFQPQFGLVRFNTSNLVVPENGQSGVVGTNSNLAKIDIERINGSDGVASINYTTVDKTAKAGKDYVKTNGTLTWTDKESGVKSVVVPIIDNSIFDGPVDRTFSFVLSSSPSGIQFSGPTSLDVLIIDDEIAPPIVAGSVKINTSSAVVDEKSGTLSIQVERFGGKDGAVSVGYSTQDGTAKAGTNYVAKFGTLSWADQESGIKNLSLSILDDKVVNGGTTLSLSFVLNSPMGGLLLTPQSSITIGIKDTDVFIPPLDGIPPPNNNPLIVTPYDNIPNFGRNPDNVSIKSGNWSDSSIWSLGHVPKSGENVAILGTTSVLYDVNDSIGANPLFCVSVQYEALLSFKTDSDTSLLVTNLLVLEGGTLMLGNNENPIQSGIICKVTFDDTPLDSVNDPSQYGNGLIVLGKIISYGKETPNTFIRLAKSPQRNETTLSLVQSTVGWNVGDKLVLPDTHQLNYWETQLYYQNYGAQWETPTIAAISADGLTITLKDPLQFDHFGNTEFEGHVANISHNIIIKSKNSSGNRAHCMFTGNAEVDIRYSQFAGMGRTKNEPFSETNISGRYPVQFANLTKAFTFEGNSIVCFMNPFIYRWGLTINNSHNGSIKNNVIYNWAGACVCVVNGNEIGNVFDGNYASRSFGTGGRKDGGAEGAGFWFRGPCNIIRNNVASNIRGSGPYCYGFVIYAENLGTANTPYGPIDMNSVPLAEFSNNEVYGATYNGLTLWWIGTAEINIKGVAGTVKNTRIWNVDDKGYFGYATNKLVIDGWIQRGDYVRPLGAPENLSQYGLFFGDYFQGNFTAQNLDITGVQTAIEIPYYFENGFTVKDSSFYCRVGINFIPPWSVSGAEKTPPRKTILSNIKYKLFQGTAQMAPACIARIYKPFGNIVQLDQVFVTDHNGITGDNFQVFYKEQKADFIVPQTGSNQQGNTDLQPVIASPEVNLTNQQNWDKYKLCIAGEIAPINATQRDEIIGLVA